MTVSVAAIVVAGGSGERFGRDGGKQLALVAGRPVLAWSIAALAASPDVTFLVIVCPPDRRDEYAEYAVEPLKLSLPVVFADSGASRQDSVRSGLSEVPADVDLIAVHDGARPLVRRDLVDRLISTLAEHPYDGVVPAHPSVDTLKSVSDGVVVATPDRDCLWAAQTPQVFRARPLREAHRLAETTGFVGTDDASLVERAGGTVGVVMGPRDNIKVTLPEDLGFVRYALSPAEGEPMTRIGIGYDVHAFAEGRRLVLGGVDIPYERGLAGHSDADVLVHAVADAVLGALRAGDIGKLFPDTDPQFKDADSLVLLRRVATLAEESGWRITDVDCVLVMECPKVSPYREKMRSNIAAALGVAFDSVGVKATTTEGLGFEGRSEGVGAQAVVLLDRSIGTGV